MLNDDWLKLKCLRVHDFVIGGWLGSDLNKPDALLLGEFVDGELRYVGRMGTPLDSRLVRSVRRLLSPRESSPFKDMVDDPGANFCDPSFRAWSSFSTSWNPVICDILSFDGSRTESSVKLTDQRSSPA